MKKILSLLMVLLMVGLVAVSGCADTAEDVVDDVDDAAENMTDMAENATEEMENEEMTIVETAIAAGSFDTLVTAVQEAGLVETLSGEGPFTVFAPTDEAFAALPEGTLEGLLEDKEALTSVLTYHVVPGQAMSGELSDMMVLETVQGEEVTIYITNESVMVNDANVTQADIETSNGVIHVIDKVILPPSMAN